MRMQTVLAGLLLVIGFFVLSSANGHANGRSCRDRCPPPAPIQVVLKACHPCTGCEYDILVCVPACCTDVPCVSHHRTLIGDGRTVYEWSCGHKVIVRFPCGGGYRVIQRG